MLKLLAHLNAFRELLACGLHRSTPKAFTASSGKETFEGISVTNPPLRQPQESMSQVAESRDDIARVRTVGAYWAFSTGQETSPKKMQ